MDIEFIEIRPQLNALHAATRELGDLAGKPQIISQGPWKDRNFEVQDEGLRILQMLAVISVGIARVI
jgi:hypothetical protein